VPLDASGIDAEAERHRENGGHHDDARDARQDHQLLVLHQDSIRLADELETAKNPSHFALLLTDDGCPDERLLYREGRWLLHQGGKLEVSGRRDQ
jgi:hypothetical protein